MTSIASVAAPRWRLRDVVLLAPKILLTGLLILAIADMVFGVVMRYVVTAITDRLDVDPFNFFFVEEIGEYTLTWLTMVGAAIGIAERAHFTLHLLTHRLPPAAQRPIHVATHLLIAGFGALAVWFGAELAIVNSALNSPALEINLAWVYAAPAVGGVPPPLDVSALYTGHSYNCGGGTSGCAPLTREGFCSCSFDQ